MNKIKGRNNKQSKNKLICKRAIKKRTEIPFSRPEENIMFAQVVTPSHLNFHIVLDVREQWIKNKKGKWKPRALILIPKSSYDND